MVIAIDCETTTTNKGNPHNEVNKLVCWSYSSLEKSDCFPNTQNLQHTINEATKLIFFNAKFDLQWFVREGMTYEANKVWDVQLAHFILSKQTHRYPSLNEVCEHYGLPIKLDVVKTEYWDKGIDTDQIPWDILSEYAKRDTELTLQCYYKQLEEMTPAQIKLCKLQCLDLSILREMEQNGLPYDETLCDTRSQELEETIETAKKELANVYPNLPINFGSNDQLSAFLYGGIIKEECKEFIGHYKSGIKTGQPKYKTVVVEHPLPRLYQPLKGSEMAKDGVFATDEGTLRKLKGKRKVLDLILELSKMEKLNGTYYKGLVKLRREMNWKSGKLHGNFNQCVAQTGRLSSSKPNLQNFATDLQDIFISKYND
jgi:DNA polymerase I